MKLNCRLLLAALAAGFLALAGNASANEPYLKKMPTKAEIDAAYPLGGADPVDAAARRTAAYEIAAIYIATSKGRDGSPANLNKEESVAYRAFADDAPLALRNEMGWPRVGCGRDQDCFRYDELVTDYVWRDKKKARAFAAEFRSTLFADKDEMVPDEYRYTKMQRHAMALPALFMLIGGLALGFAAARPWVFVREGEITSLGSGIAKTGGGLTYLSRNHVTIGDKKLGTTITSPRVDDALMEAGEGSGAARVGVGTSFGRNWALSVKGPAETVREPFLSFAVQTFAVTPLLGVIGLFALGVIGALLKSGHLSMFGMAFAATYTLGSILKNILAWRA